MIVYHYQHRLPVIFILYITGKSFIANTAAYFAFPFIFAFELDTDKVLSLSIHTPLRLEISENLECIAGSWGCLGSVIVLESRMTSHPTAAPGNASKLAPPENQSQSSIRGRGLLISGSQNIHI